MEQKGSHSRKKRFKKALYKRRPSFHIKRECNGVKRRPPLGKKAISKVPASSLAGQGGARLEAGEAWGVGPCV